MLKQLLDWWLCFGEPVVLHQTKIEFFKKAKEAKVKHTAHLWDLAKTLYPNTLAIEDIDYIIASATGRHSLIQV